MAIGSPMCSRAHGRTTARSASRAIHWAASVHCTGAGSSFFDLHHGWLVEAESQRDARDLELELRGPLKLHRSPAPLTVQDRAGGKTEWVRGASEPLVAAVAGLAERGYYVHPLRPWLHAAMLQRADRLYAWSAAQLPEEESHRHARADIEAALRDALDAHEALGIDPRPWLPAHVAGWFG